ncbi:probable LRR receptor-like serine/threonine-protein kinase isoform X2 [Tanacetum coccineum]
MGVICCFAYLVSLPLPEAQSDRVLFMGGFCARNTGNFLRRRISDLSGNTSQIPDLFNMGNMTKLMLRSCNITGSIPAYISEMYNLRHL